VEDLFAPEGIGILLGEMKVLDIVNELLRVGTDGESATIGRFRKNISKTVNRSPQPCSK